MCAAPLKPWEGSIASAPGALYSHSNVPMVPTMLGGPSTSAAPPPLPPRSGGSYNYSNLNYRGMGPYDRYSNPYAYGRSSFLPSQYDMWTYRRGEESMEGPLAQMAAEAWSPAFSSIENMLRAFSSMSYLLESSYQAIHMSFRAVLSVADNMAKMKNFLLEVLASLAALKTIRGFYRWILRIFGLVSGVEEEAWAAAAAGPPPTSTSTSLWPIAAFLGLMFGGPYVLYKLLAPSGPPPSWDPETRPGVPVTTIWEFETTNPEELPFQKGETLFIAPPPYSKPRSGWALAANRDKKTGLIPLNRVQGRSRRTRQM